LNFKCQNRKITMKTEVNRRNFIKMASVAGITGCAFLLTSKLNPVNASFNYSKMNEVPDLKKLNYCGYQCPDDCQFLQATRENNDSLKMLAYNNWKIKEKYGIEFEADKTFCWGCKTKDKPVGIVLSNCQVRKCAIEKGYECCIECTDLAQCDFELWKKFPDFYKQVLEMQKNFKASK
jgi:hypothetical protein